MVVEILNKIMWSSMTVGFLVSLIMVFLTRSVSYLNASENVLMIILLLFTMTMIGLGISKLFDYMFGKEDTKHYG